MTKNNDSIFYAYKVISKHPWLIFWTSFYKKDDFDEQYYLKEIKNVVKEGSNYYIHIPFCMTLCTFCYCHKVQNIDEDYHKKYLLYLEKELKIYYKLNWKKKLVYASINIWWWTPNLLSDENFVLLFDILERYFDFSNKDILFNIDLHISFFSKIKLATIKKYCNRVSVGIQTYNSKLLSDANRHSEKEKFYDAYLTFFKNNWIKINIDLMIWLKNQTQEDVDLAIRRMIYLKVDNISLNYFHKKEWVEYDFWEEWKKLIESSKLKWDNFILKYNNSRNSQVDMGTRRYNIIWIWVWAIWNIYWKIWVHRTSFDNYFSKLDQWKLFYDNYIIMDDYLEIVSYFLEKIICNINNEKCISLYWEKSYKIIIKKLKKLFKDRVLIKDNDKIFSTIPDKEVIPLLADTLLKDYIEKGFFWEFKKDYDIKNIEKEYSLFFSEKWKFGTSR